MSAEKVVYEDILQVLEFVKDHCQSRSYCKGCVFSGDALADDEPFSYCTIRRNPDHWQTDIIKMNVEARKQKGV